MNRRKAALAAWLVAPVVLFACLYAIMLYLKDSRSLGKKDPRWMRGDAPAASTPVDHTPGP